MAKLKNPLLSMRASGSLGRVLTFVRRNKVDLVEKKPVVPDAKTPAQLYHRNMFGLCVDLWHLLSDAEQQAWESAARPLHMTGYNWYISQCLRPNPGIYLPLAGGVMSGDIEMDGHHLHGLTAPTHFNDAARKAYVDTIVGAYTQGARVTHDTPMNLPNTTSTAILFNQEAYDTDGIHDNAVNNSRLTCRTAGKYIIVGNARISSNATGVRVATIKLNATSIIGYLAIEAVGDTVTIPNVSTIWDMGVGDYVELLLYQSSGIQLTSDIDSPYAPSFMMQRIG